MREAQARFEKYLKRHFGQSSTLKHYHSDLNIFIDSLSSEKMPEAVTPHDIDGFIDQQIAAGRKATTINRRLACLHSFFEYLAREQPTARWPNPVVGRRHYLKMGSRLPRDVSDDDVARLFGVIERERDLAMFGIMVGAGLRVGEVVTLRQQDVEAPNESGQLARLRLCGKGDKERMVWLTPSVWAMLEAWLDIRPDVESDDLFLNWRGKVLSVAGVQYCLKQYCQTAEVDFSCHQLRHTFARRLAENGLPVDSLARLLGHSRLTTTQRYIDGADPTVRSDFTTALDRLESSLKQDRMPPVSPEPRPPSGDRTAPVADLEKLCRDLTPFPSWLGEGLEAYLRWRWPTWRRQTAYQIGGNFVNTIGRIWSWLDLHCAIDSWTTFGRADLEAWLQARSESGVSNKSVRCELGQLKGLLNFLEERGQPLDPGLFRVRAPKDRRKILPRYLTERDYRCLEQMVWQKTEADTYHAYFDRAWFLMLAHTGVRLSELLDLRLEDLNLTAGYVTIRGGKPGRDRVVFLTSGLCRALQHYLAQRPDIPTEDRVFLLHGRSPTGRTIQNRLRDYGQLVQVAVSPIA